MTAADVGNDIGNRVPKAADRSNPFPGCEVIRDPVDLVYRTR
jgi:hypothetical protein